MKKAPACDNCGFKHKDVKVQGEKKLCDVCASSMPGIYAVGGSAEHSIPAVVMRQISFCTNLILSEIRASRGDGHA